MNFTYPTGIGAVIAIIVLVLAVVFLAIGTLTPLIAGFFIALALCRLL